MVKNSNTEAEKEEKQRFAWAQLTTLAHLLRQDEVDESDLKAIKITRETFDTYKPHKKHFFEMAEADETLTMALSVLRNEEIEKVKNKLKSWMCDSKQKIGKRKKKIKRKKLSQISEKANEITNTMPFLRTQNLKYTKSWSSGFYNSVFPNFSSYDQTMIDVLTEKIQNGEQVNNDVVNNQRNKIYPEKKRKAKFNSWSRSFRSKTKFKLIMESGCTNPLWSFDGHIVENQKENEDVEKENNLPDEYYDIGGDDEKMPDCW